MSREVAETLMLELKIQCIKKKIKISESLIEKLKEENRNNQKSLTAIRLGVRLGSEVSCFLTYTTDEGVFFKCKTFYVACILVNDYLGLSQHKDLSSPIFPEFKKLTVLNY